MALIALIGVTFGTQVSCHSKESQNIPLSPREILGNPDFPAICYGGFRHSERQKAPSVEQIVEDIRILHAAGFRVLRTYHARLHEHTPNLLRAIRMVKDENPDFEMYVVLGAWMQCEGAWTENANHHKGDSLHNSAEIDAAVALAKLYPDIVRIIAVGNESMVHWATGYYVDPEEILFWVDYLQSLKKEGTLPADLWITSSDNFAAWGGGDSQYHTDALEKLIQSVDYISLHTYPFHDTHYNPEFWYVPEDQESSSPNEQIRSAMDRAFQHARSQYQNVADYVESLGVAKPIHIGETGWATVSDDLFGYSGSRAADEYKQMLFYDDMLEWSKSIGVTMFFFEAFDEPWKDGISEHGSENHFGLFSVSGNAKLAFWEKVDDGTFEGLSRGGNAIVKSMGGNLGYAVLKTAPPAFARFTPRKRLRYDQSVSTSSIESSNYYVLTGSSNHHRSSMAISIPSAPILLNGWEGTCQIHADQKGVIQIDVRPGPWWGCALEIEKGGLGEDLSSYSKGELNFEMKTSSNITLEIGFQTGHFGTKELCNNGIQVGNPNSFTISDQWQFVTLKISELNRCANLADVSSPLYLLGKEMDKSCRIYLRNIHYSK